MNSTHVHKGILALIIANIIWGFASPIFKWSLTNIPPFTLAFLRFSIAPVLLGVYLAITKQLTIPKMHISDWRLLFFYAGTGITINIIFFFLGIQRTLALNGPVIASAQPLLVFLIAPIFLKEIITKKQIIGMIIGTAGIAAIVLEPLYYVGIDGDFIGNMFIVIATFGAVISTLIGRSLFQKHNPLTLTFWAFIIGALTFLPLAVFEYSMNPLIYTQFDIRALTGIVFGAVFSSALAYSLFCWGLSKIPASEASMFIYIDPIAGTILSYFMLHEPITIPFVIGALCIFGGIFIAEKRIHYHPFRMLRNQKSSS